MKMKINTARAWGYLYQDAVKGKLTLSCGTYSYKPNWKEEIDKLAKWKTDYLAKSF